MKNQFSSKGELLLRQMTEERINESRSDFGKKNLHIGGRFYKVATVFAYISAVYNLIMFLAHFFGAYDKSLSSYVDEDFTLFWKMQSRTFLIIIVILATALVMLYLKKRFLYSCFALASALFYFVNSTFMEVITTKTEITRLALFIPAIIILVICATYIFVTHILDYTEYKRVYSKLVDKIVATHPTKAGEITTSAQWEMYIKEYSEPAVHIKPKRSLRKKMKKEQANTDTAQDAEKEVTDE